MIPKVNVHKVDSDRIHARLNLLEFLAKLDIKAAKTRPWWLCKDPASQVQAITELMRSGLIDVKKAKELLNV